MNFRLLIAASFLFACGGVAPQDASSADEAYRKHHDGGTPPHDGGTPGTDAGTPGGADAGVPSGGSCANSDQCLGGDLCTTGVCVASACNQRHPGVSGIRATFRVDQYLGLRNGHSGTHELANGTLQGVLWIYQPSLEDTTSVQLAMNVASSLDPQGLPHEVPMTAGEVIEIEGEYIPGSQAGLSGRAVIHYTHGACGYATIGGVTY